MHCEKMTDFQTKALTPELAEDYFDFFDHRAFADGSPFYPCYCNAFNLSFDQLQKLFALAETGGGGTEGWRKTLRDSAWQMVRNGLIHGYLAYDGEHAVGWCNANDRMNYYRVGEFDTDHLPEDMAPANCPGEGFIKSIVCFEISPAYRGRGIARKLLEQVCKDAKAEGYAFAEAYPKEKMQDSALSFTGPFQLYEKAGFTEYGRNGSTIIMRKALQEK